MSNKRFDQQRLAMVGAAFETGYMSGQTGAGGSGREACLCRQPRPTRAAGPAKHAHIHKVPSVPITLDGEKAPPERVKEYDGRPLYYVIDNVESEGVLQVFSTRETLAERYSRVSVDNTKARRPVQETISAQAASPFLGDVELCEHVDYRGEHWVFRSEWGNIPDFTSVLCALWWCNDINDKVSSLRTGVIYTADQSIRPWTVLYEDVFYQGNFLAILNNPPETWVPDLAMIGWNDRFSSMAYRLTL